MYADDAVIYSSDENPYLAMAEANMCFNSLIHWCNENKLTLNYGKTKHMLVGNKIPVNRCRHAQIIAPNTCLSNVQSYNYLGVEID